MTDAERIRKLAEWMGWQQDGMNLRYWWDEENKKYHPYDWNPLKHIQDAWMLVEKAQSEGRIVEVRCEPIKWACYLGPYLGGRMALADTAPRAICEAILKLMEEQNDPHP